MKSSSKVKKISVQKLSVFGTILLILIVLIVFSKKINLSEEHLDCLVQLSDVDYKGKKSFDEDDIEDEAFFRAYGMMSDKNEKKSLHLYKRLNLQYNAYIESAKFEKCEYKSDTTLLTCKEYGNNEIYLIHYDFTSKKLETSVHMPDDDGIYVEYSCE